MTRFLNPIINNADIDIIDYLNSNIWVRLGNTKYGVGVIAIRDIPKNVEITDYDLPSQRRGNASIENLYIKIFLVNYENFLQNFDRLHTNIQTLIKDRYILRDSNEGHIMSPNSHQLYRLYINHSDNPNVNNDLISTQDIKEGDEITFSYKDILSKDTSVLSKNYYNYVFGTAENFCIL